MYPLDGLLADEGTKYWHFCFGLPQDPAALERITLKPTTPRGTASLALYW
jgi:hypothetical protein